MTATMERPPAENTPIELPTQTQETSPVVVGNIYAVTRLHTEFQGFNGRGDLWVAEEPSMPDFMNASIKMQDRQSAGIDSLIVPYRGEPMMSRDLEDEFRDRNITIYPVMIARRSLARHKYPWEIGEPTPKNLVTVKPRHVAAIAESYTRELAEYAIPLSAACGWPALVAFAGINKLHRQGKDTGTTAVFSAYRGQSTAPPQSQLLRGIY